MDFGTYHTFTARLIADGFIMRPGTPPTPGYRLYTLEDERRVFIDPNIPESAHRGIVHVVQSAEIPLDLLQDQII